MTALLTDFDEGTLLQRLLLHPAGTDALRDVLRLPQHPGRYATFANVDLRPFGAHGDVDLLIVGAGGPATTTAVECKRVRVRPEDRVRPSPSKLRAVRRAAVQTRTLTRLGFHRVVLLIVLATDGRDQVQVNMLFRHASWDHHDAIAAFARSLDLPRRVGIAVIEWAQPTDRSAELCGSLNWRVIHAAGAVRQPTPLTQAIAGLVKSSADAASPSASR